jgi:hypothetical protein
MAKITAVGLTKNGMPDMWVRVYVVSEDGAIRPANRKDVSKRYVTTVKSVERVEGTRLYRVVVSMGEMIVQGSQWFDLVDLDVSDDKSEPAPVPAIVSTPDIDTYESVEVPDDSTSYDMGYEHGQRDAKAALDEEIRGLLNSIAELTTNNAKLYERLAEPETGFSLVADQVGILHVAYEDEPTITCRTPIRAVSVVATGVRALHPGRKVCPKCERKARESAE